MSKNTDSPDGGAMPAGNRKTRRFFLAAGSTTAVFATLGAAAAMAASVDPIFAAIERHKVAEDIWIESNNRADEFWCRDEGIAFTQEAVTASEAASADEFATLADFLATVPTTPAGIRAALEYVTLCDGRNYGPRMIASVLRSPALAA